MNEEASVATEQDAAPVEDDSSATSIAESPAEVTAESANVQPAHVLAEAAVAANATPTSAGTDAKATAIYWLQRARQNPVPAGIGGALLLLFFWMMVIKRRKSNRLPATAVLSEALHAHPEVEAETVAVVEPVSATSMEVTQSSRPEDGAVGDDIIGAAIQKLVLDNTHRADIMGSRAPEDRKAIELSLIRVITAGATSDDDRRRARVALEEYGFVAQHSATLLKAQNPWERSSAALVLGLIGSKTSMPFLIEALNDADSVVRNEAIASLASLKDPAAIGALFEASRKHPDVPASLLSETLSACSVDSLRFLDVPPSESASTSEAERTVHDEGQWVEELTQDFTDDILSGWLAPLDNSREEDRTKDLFEPTTTPHVVRAVVERPYLRVVA